MTIFPSSSSSLTFQSCLSAEHCLVTHTSSKCTHCGHILMGLSFATPAFFSVQSRSPWKWFAATRKFFIAANFVIKFLKCTHSFLAQGTFDYPKNAVGNFKINQHETNRKIKTLRNINETAHLVAFRARRVFALQSQNRIPLCRIPYMCHTANSLLYPFFSLSIYLCAMNAIQ